MGYSIRADLAKEMDGQTKLHRFRYHLARGFVDIGDVVLDIGCGQGYGTKIIAPAASKVVSIDIDKDSIKVLQEENEFNHVSYIHADLEKTDLPDCDVACAFEVIEHLYTPLPFVMKLKKATGKYICMSVPIGQKLVWIEEAKEYQEEHDSTHHSAFPNMEYVNKLFMDNQWDIFYGFMHGPYYIAVYYNKENIV